MARFHSYSFANILSVVRACPNATRVAGIRTWNELGRFVKRGEKGIVTLPSECVSLSGRFKRIIHPRRCTGISTAGFSCH